MRPISGLSDCMMCTSGSLSCLLLLNCDAKSEVLSCSYFATFHPFSAPDWHVLQCNSRRHTATQVSRSIHCKTFFRLSGFRQVKLPLSFCWIFCLVFLHVILRFTHLIGFSRNRRKKMSHLTVSTADFSVLQQRSHYVSWMCIELTIWLLTKKIAWKNSPTR